jgi:uncharacterized protein (UPF0218 family)
MKKIIIVFIALLFISCASRKVAVNKSESKSIVKSDSTAKIVEEIKAIIITKKDIEKTEFNYEPIDPKVDFVIDGKTYRNVRINHKKQSDNTIIKEDIKESKKQDIAVKNKAGLKAKELIKKVDKKSNHFVYLWLLLIPILYVIYNRFKI